MLGAFEVVLAASLVLVVYHYILYPALVIGLAGMRIADPQVGAGAHSYKVTMVIAAYNEERVIGGKLRNTLAGD